MLKERVVIPPSPGRGVLQEFLLNHPGTKRTKSIERGYAYWPGMDKDRQVFTKGPLKYHLVEKGPSRENPIQ